MKPLEAAELVAILVASYPSARVAERTVQVYERMMLDLDHQAGKRAIQRLIATSKFLPSIAEIRAEASAVQHGPKRFGGEAWGDVNEAVRRFGRYSEPTFDDPLVAECVRQFGWQSICDSTNDTADRARFIELYDSLATREHRELAAGSSLALPSRQERGRMGNRNVGQLLAGIGSGGK